MPSWWSRLLGSPKALAAVGVAAVAVVAVVAALILASDSDDASEASTSSQPAAQDPGSAPAPGEEDEPQDDDPDAPPAPLPPDRDAYCPAFAEIREGGLTTPRDEESDQVDLAELGRTFDRLLVRYTAAERVSPRRLRDDYAQTIGYLEQGKRAVESRDVELLKALVTNLDSLNESMAAIETTSERFCG